jgi:hypothetical protein
VASPFGCRSGHISAFAEATLPRDGQVGEGVSPALDAQPLFSQSSIYFNSKRLWFCDKEQSVGLPPSLALTQPYAAPALAVSTSTGPHHDPQCAEQQLGKSPQDCGTPTFQGWALSAAL